MKTKPGLYANDDEVYLSDGYFVSNCGVQIILRREFGTHDELTYIDQFILTLLNNWVKANTRPNSPLPVDKPRKRRPRIGADNG